MMTTSAQYHGSVVQPRDTHEVVRRFLLLCGILGAAMYPLSDIVAALRYPGFSYWDQAVSELFAIGAPTSCLLVILFTVSSTLLFLFAIGIWMSANGKRLVHWMSVMMALNTIDAILLWNFFPMHMRGEQPTFTDTMHVILAIDPFLTAVLVLAAIAFRNGFRKYTIATLVFTTALAATAILYVPMVFANEPTPWMGIAERSAQYATQAWFAVLAILLLHTKPPEPQKSQSTTHGDGGVLLRPATTNEVRRD